MLSIYFSTNNSIDWGETQIKENKQDKSTIFELNKTQKKYYNILPKFYKVDLDSIKGKNYVIDYNKEEIKIDKKIGNTKQVKNDCWLLTGVNALANSQKGQEYIKRAIIKNDESNTTIYFKGTNTSVTIPKIALNATKQSKYYVKGDDDMLAIEVATEYYKKMLIKNKEALNNQSPNIINGKHSLGNINDALAGGFSSDILFLITGEKSTTYFNKNSDNLNYIKKLINKIKEKPNKYITICNFKEKRNKLYINHAYTIKKADEKFVTLINPHNSAKEEKIPINEFYENIKSLTFLEL